MDFDDLDEAIEQRLAEGGELPEDFVEKAEKATRATVLPSPLPPVERNSRIPLPDDLLKILKERAFALRAYLFYGPGDSVQSMSKIIHSAPTWLEVIVHEWPGHGFRKDEAPCSDVEALADDAFDAIAASLEVTKAGGAFEGAPFVLIGHSIGAQLLAPVARKLEWKLGVTPVSVIALDRAAPNVPLLSQQGVEQLGSEPDELLKAYNHQVWKSGQSKDEPSVKALTTWVNDLQHYARDCTKDVGFHKFDCDLLLIRSAENQKINDLAKKGSKYRMTTVKIEGSGESISLPVQIDVTDVKQIKETLASLFGAKVSDLTISTESGTQKDTDTVGSNVIVKGIQSFRNSRYTWPHPTVIIGGGYRGIKTAAAYMNAGNPNFILFDRHSKFGGDAWIDAATNYSKLQTDFAAFNIWWGPDFAITGEGGYGRPGWYTWFNRNEILQSFQKCAEEYGIVPHCHFNSDVTGLEIIGDPEAHDRYYDLTIDSLDKKKDPFTVKASVIYHYGGSYHQNRLIEYPGEDQFQGQIGYGMGEGFIYNDERMKNARVAILGNGAFAVENVRTCVENGADKVFIVTRRKNLASPRVPCWFAHQGPLPTPGDMILKLFQPMYELTGMGDPFSYWAVVSNKERTYVTLSQASRFGIGDVTFLCHAYGKLEYVQDTLQRLTKHTLHLTSGQKLENITGLVKALGLMGDFRFDKLHKITHRLGDMVNGDFRRVIQIDATGMHAANFTTFALGIGVAGFVRQWQYIHSNPYEYYRAVEEFGLLQMLPVHKGSKTQPDQPIYVTNVQYEMSASIIFAGFFPQLQLFNEEDSPYKYGLVHTCHPIDKFLDECHADWDKYQKLFKEQGCTREYIKYPYTKEIIQGFFDEYSKRVYPIEMSGPSEKQKEELLDRVRQSRKALDQARIPQLVKRSELHSQCKGDPYAFAWAKSVHGDRSRITASSATSAADFDQAQYEQWSEWTSGKLSIEDVETDSNSLLSHQRTWELILGSLDKLKAQVK